MYNSQKCHVHMSLTITQTFCSSLLSSVPLSVHPRLFRERLDQVKVKLDEVLTGKAGEYREPLATLQKNMQLRTQVAGNNNSAVHI